MCLGQNAYSNHVQPADAFFPCTYAGDVSPLGLHIALVVAAQGATAVQLDQELVHAPARAVNVDAAWVVRIACSRRTTPSVKVHAMQGICDGLW